MCGRIVQKTPLGLIAINLGLAEVSISDRGPRYNLPPGGLVISLRSNSKFGYLKWGLVPSWAKDPKIGFSLTNARSETITEKPSFKAAFKSRRCVIPVDGFYEWKSVSGKKMPYYIHRTDGDLLLLGGLWESWKTPEGEILETCCVVTTGASAPITEVHDRMPVFIPRNRLDNWISENTDTSTLKDLFLAPAAGVSLTPVNPIVNNARIDNESCLNPFLE
jgi:putative SOS response-associated peptidase YedK